MAHHTRAQPSTSGGAPHAISLKVLRLSRPSLATQTPLPATSFGNGLDISPSASLAYPGADDNSTFPLTPLLTLPAAFGAAYVGETFTCTLCANCEVAGDGDGRSVSGVRIHAELQTPAEQQGISLELKRADGEGHEGGLQEGEMQPGQTLQYTLTHDLKEEGPHVLAVTVSYTETLRSSDGGGGASGGRARTFRKLYQFVAQPLIAVRSKVTELKRRSKPGSGEGRQWVLEAQLENVGETAVVLERLWLTERDGAVGKGVNGDEEGSEHAVLKPQDVEQVMFSLREEMAEDVGQGRVPLAQVNINWRSAMGEKGSLTTGWLASRPR